MKIFQKIFPVLLLLLLSFLGLYFSFDKGILWFVYPSQTEYPIRGIDVSNHQGEIDWEKVPKSKIQFVYIKATEGGDWKDKAFLRKFVDIILS